MSNITSKVKAKTSDYWNNDNGILEMLMNAEMLSILLHSIHLVTYENIILKP